MEKRSKWTGTVSFILAALILELSFAQDRGQAYDYDPGPPTESGWAELFADVPNYREINIDLGKEWLRSGKLDQTNQRLPKGREIKKYTMYNKFRYTMGPMFYRGRLDGTARVLIVGQEGATDEALAHRSFVGGTGQKMQNFLYGIGINRSYLFVNTFVYSIYEQYDPFADELAHSGPILKHRNRIFDKAFADNEIELVITVGTAARTSFSSWLQMSHKGKLPTPTRHVHVMHPGAGAFGASPGLIRSFNSAYQRIWDWKGYGWLKNDDGVPVRRLQDYRYRDAPLPFADLPYGIQPFLGDQGTMSERAHSGLQIQFRSPKGRRFGAPNRRPDRGRDLGDSAFFKLSKDELAWEPPKVDAPHRFDAGPGKYWAQFLEDTPNLASVAQAAGVRKWTDFDRPVWYRGRIENGTTLVLAQSESPDDLIAGRALVGEKGQRINQYLYENEAGLDYVILSVIPWNLSRVAGERDRKSLNETDALVDFRNQILGRIIDSREIKEVVLVGELARSAWAIFSDSRVNKKDRDLQVTELEEVDLPNFLRQIPREDLPYGKPLWFGTSGTLSEQPDENWLLWNAPLWIGEISPWGDSSRVWRSDWNTLESSM